MSSEIISLEAALIDRNNRVIAEAQDAIDNSYQNLARIAFIYSGQLTFDYTGLDTHPDLREAW